MKLSKLLLVLSVLLVGVYSINAQRTTKSAEVVELRKNTYMDKLADELSLTATQKAEIEKSSQKYAAEREILAKEYQKIREEHRAKMKIVSEKERVALENILTSEQQAKLKALKEKKMVENPRSEYRSKRFEGVQQKAREQKKIE